MRSFWESTFSKRRISINWLWAVLFLSGIFLIPIGLFLADQVSWSLAFLPLALILALVILVKPFWGLIIFVLAGMTMRFISLPVFGELGTMVGSVLIVSVLLEELRHRGIFKPALRKELLIPIFLFMATSIISSLQALHVDLAFNETFRLITRFVPFYLILSSQLRSEKRLKGYSWAIIALSIYWVIEASFRYLYFSSWFFDYRFARGNASAVGLAVQGIPIALWLLWEEKNRKVRHLLGLLVLIFAFAVVISYSRAALVGLLSIPLTLAIWRYRFNPRFWIAISIIGLLLFGLMPRSVWEDRILYTFRYGEDAAGVDTRLNLWAAGMLIFREYPLLGVGLGNSIYIMATYRALADIGESGYGSYVHNAFLDIAVSEGIIGLLAYLSIWIMTFIRLVKTKRIASKIQNAALEHFSLVMIASLMALAVVSMFGSAWDSKTFWSLVGISAVIFYYAQQKQEIPSISDIHVF